MQLEDVTDPKSSRARAELDCALHRADVADDSPSASIGDFRRELGPREPPMRHFEALDSRGGDSLGAQKLSSENLERAEVRCPFVERTDLRLGMRHHCGDVGRELQVELGDGIG